MITWEELSKEYIKEINDLWTDIESAIIEFEKGMPKSYKSGLVILEKCLDLSTENVKMLSCLSTEGITKKEEFCSKKSSTKEITKKDNKSESIRKDKRDENCFKWLHNTE